MAEMHTVCLIKKCTLLACKRPPCDSVIASINHCNQSSSTAQSLAMIRVDNEAGCLLFSRLFLPSL